MAGNASLIFSLNVVERESDPQFVQVIPAQEMVLVATFGVQASGSLEPGELCICIPFLNIENYIGKVGAQNRFAQVHRQQTDAQRVHLEKVVKETMVDLEVELGKATLSIGKVLDLTVGDVVVLDQHHEEPLQAKSRSWLNFAEQPVIVAENTAFCSPKVNQKG